MSRLCLIIATCFIPFLLPIASSAQTFYQFDVISQTGNPVPDGNSAFVSIPPSPRISVGLVMYSGEGSNGEKGFYAGGIAGGGIQPCWVVVDNTMPVPGGQGNYLGFGAASWDDGNAAFHAFGSGGEDGVYVAADTIPCWLVADTNSPIPGGQGNYTGFDAVAIEGDMVAFHAFGAGGEDGIYAADDVVPCWIVADLATPIPGGQHGNFTAFALRPFVDQGAIAFAGLGGGYAGLFMHDGNQLVTLDDTDRPVPGGNGTYAQFITASFGKNAVAFHGQGTSGEDGIFVADVVQPCWSVAIKGDPMPGGAVLQGIEGVAFDGTHVAFVGLGSKAIYSDLGGVMRLVIAVGDVLDNRVIDDLAIGPEGLSASRIAFWAHFTDKTEAVYLATYLPDVSGVDDTPPAIAMAFTNYPNPFADRTDFEFVLPGAGRVRLEVYDVAGRLVATRDLGVRESGENRATFDGRGLATGVYFCRLQSGAYAVTRKMLIER